MGKRLRPEPLFLQGYNLLMDVFDSQEMRTSSEMEKIANLLAEHPKFGKECAVLVNPAYLVRIGLDRMLSALAENKGLDFAIFYNLDYARKFLGTNLHLGVEYKWK